MGYMPCAYMIATIKRVFTLLLLARSCHEKGREKKYSVPILDTHVPYYFVSKIDCS